MFRSLIRLVVLVVLIWAAIHYWPDIKGVFSHQTQAKVTHVVTTVKSDYHKVAGVASTL
ncbi:hypothetical protein [Ferrimicrobium sp.]